jgi:hypothetical protein
LGAPYAPYEEPGGANAAAGEGTDPGIIGTPLAAATDIAGTDECAFDAAGGAADPGAAPLDGRGSDPGGNAWRSCVLPCLFDGEAAAEAAPIDGCAMLGTSMACVAGTPRFTPLDAASLELWLWIALARAAPPAASNAPRRESTLLTASGDTCGAELGSPIPGVVLASSGGSEGGGP